jgi:hypothetical protein
MSAMPQKPDDLDRTLSAHFKRQMPDPFPPCRALEQAEPSSLYRLRRPASAGRSQLALAASVAGLLGLGLYVSSGVQPPRAAKTPAPANAPGLINGATADGAKLLDQTKGR